LRHHLDALIQDIKSGFNPIENPIPFGQMGQEIRHKQLGPRSTPVYQALTHLH
jgi:hypothetical protein